MHAFYAYVYVRTYVYVHYCLVVMYIGVAILQIVYKVYFAVLHELAYYEYINRLDVSHIGLL